MPGPSNGRRARTKAVMPGGKQIDRTGRQLQGAARLAAALPAQHVSTPSQQSDVQHNYWLCLAAQPQLTHYPSHNITSTHPPSSSIKELLNTSTCHQK
jgi:hypothetical protein